MANLKEIRNRITSVSATEQVTSAMKMVAAAKLKKTQDAIIKISPYANKLHEILTSLSDDEQIIKENIYFQQKPAKNILIVFVSSNRGLCGAFNSGVIKRGFETAQKKYPEQLASGNVTFIAIGKYAHDFLRKNHLNITRRFGHVFDDLTYENVVPIAQYLMNGFVNGYFDKIDLIYNRFKNAAVQILSVEQFLPIEPRINKKEEKSIEQEFIFEPTKKYIVNELIPKSLKIQLYKALLDSYASEHGARMTAMHKATDNANNLIRDLRIEYNKARQASITNEILEIVSGADALSK
ncbi:MAG: ATP synthase F1 subunit gamma [Bacteroidetes bacterium]|nr:MAG: ATP synthase F1 subunit gamma [Bacteroidota bacterium]